MTLLYQRGQVCTTRVTVQCHLPKATVSNYTRNNQNREMSSWHPSCSVYFAATIFDDRKLSGLMCI